MKSAMKNVSSFCWFTQEKFESPPLLWKMALKANPPKKNPPNKQ